uniref:Uncharacterized protein n=1 Tax=Corethron hystrix TaxID=216773 RepID=A0A7S1FT23_9STRA|mmetsp:Transcript_29485/g.67820  ORF Transcript_29485/g.67820 Transcript_29485/m.67820 type:complete len:483 (+) Transcript_29485:243-1691(+)
MADLDVVAAVTETAVHRFVPLSTSLCADAPGWGRVDGSSGSLASDAADGALRRGPTCWKCRGVGLRRAPLRPDPSEEAPMSKRQRRRREKRERRGVPRPSGDPAACPVCGGSGFLLARVPRAPDEGPAVTSPRVPYAERDPRWGPFPRGHDALLEHEASAVEVATRPSWYPRGDEQLCNLVGRWRILQRRRGHRYTTDDVVTAYVAARVYLRGDHDRRAELHVDLGCGIGSVLLMVAWRGTAATDASAGGISRHIGVEAREEAVELARRSAAFNAGTGAAPLAHVQVLRDDFRRIEGLDGPRAVLGPALGADTATPSVGLVTGTPPYFRVDFAISADSDKAAVQATIREGGMPSHDQSAPARCEFRGGVEAYCCAAARLLENNEEAGMFVMCENWVNDRRVREAAKGAGMVIEEVLPVVGKQGRGRLFGVYTMRRKRWEAKDKEKETQTVEHADLVVRDSEAKWTEEYRAVLEEMGIPAKDK